MSSRKKPVSLDLLDSVDPDGLAGLDGLASLDKLASWNFDEKKPADPIGEVDYANVTNEQAATQEVSSVLAAFKARAKAEQERFNLVTDSEYWCAVCFQTREQKEAFLDALKVLQYGDKYIDGLVLAKKLGIALPPAEVPYNTSARIDPKFAALVRERP